MYCSEFSKVICNIAGGSSASLLALLAGKGNTVGKAFSTYS